MTTLTNRRGGACRLARAAAFGLFACAAALCTASEARAQWTTNGSNINNTNPGGVGVGTSDPTLGGAVSSKFTVAAPDDSATAFSTGNGTLPRFALNHRSNGTWTMYDFTGNAWNAGITQMGGRAGIGTLTPAVRLAVNGAGTNVYNTDAWIENNMHIQGNEAMTQGGGRGHMRIGTAANE